MDTITLKQLKNNYVLTITDNNGNRVRQVSLVNDHEYVLNPINKRYEKNRGRRVIIKSIEQNRDGAIAKVTYLDTLRPGKVQIDSLDNITSDMHKNHNPTENKIEAFVYKEMVPMFQIYLDVV
ncbi:hypothetical protein M3610_24810 [Neobacillus sp. MER 74]|uniref:hypothetical protein n=1 Tax=Neobacillus sp. MER 74 TaxID=2939566 RepID=UPI0020424AEE|nr:hypothetical protein [Neobacillus sp. MER 74]MCM3118434.1 hypothetical protein [Neobacillus sp. MER 74]